MVGRSKAEREPAVVRALRRDLIQAREEQAAAAEVLRAISNTSFDLKKVLEQLTASAARLCHADMAAITRLDEDGRGFSYVTAYNFPSDWLANVRSIRLEPGTKSVVGRALLRHEIVQVEDVLAEPGYEYTALALKGGFRTFVGVPMMRDDSPIGVLALGRAKVNAFNERQLELIRTFAAHAVIAIENARLAEQVQTRNVEISHALEQQTATGDILRVIASSPTDIQPVLQVVVESAARFCDTRDASIFLVENGMLAPKAHYGPFAATTEPRPITRDLVTGRAVLDRKAVHIRDLAATGAEFATSKAIADTLGHRTLAAEPLMIENEAMGVLATRRLEARPFSDKQIKLLKTFADQAAIAIQNVRLFQEVKARSTELQEALRQQTATADVLKVISRSAFELPKVLKALVVSAAKLCNANRGGIYLRDGDLLRPGTTFGVSGPEEDEVMRTPLPFDRKTISGRVALSGQVEHIPDVLADQDYYYAPMRLSDTRVLMGVPLIRDGQVEGVFYLERPEPVPFSQRQADLVQTFSDQAVIAIENVRLFEEVQERNRALTEALEQQTATNEILRVISSSPTNLQPVFDMIAESAARLCNARLSNVSRFDGELIHFVAAYGISAAGKEAMSNAYPMPPGRTGATSRAIMSGKIEQIPDILEDSDYALLDVTRTDKARSIAAVPMLKSGRAIGAIAIGGIDPGLFSARQIGLLQTFADQAVIAIENVRLFDELQSRSAELSEALTQQTATADVLKVISRSAFDLTTVLDTLVESAVHVCEAEKGAIFQRHGDLYHFAASFGFSPEYEQYALENPLSVGRGSVTGRVAREGKTSHITDVLADPEYETLGYQQLGGHRTTLGVPLLREGLPVGVFVLTRTVVKPFSDKQIELVETFADQAVIAIENMRLFEEVKTRTSEVSEALQQQTATSEVLQVISRATFDLPAVLDALVSSAVRLCNSTYGVIYLREGNSLRAGATVGATQTEADIIKNELLEFDRRTISGRVALTGRPQNIADVLADDEYSFPPLDEHSTIRAVLGVPLLREGKVEGVFFVGRSQPGAFTERQSDLVQTFADQAVIAIQNVRLFEELQARTGELGEALQQQTATADVLKVISRSAFDLQAVLNTLIHSAASLCGAKTSAIFLRDGDVFRMGASFSQTPEHIEYEKEHPSPLSRKSWVGRCAIDKAIIHVPDVSRDLEHGLPDSHRIGGYKAVLCVPLMREGTVLGVFGMTRPEVGPFTERQIDLIRTFADQAVIAIENVRLFKEVKDRTEELSRSLEDLRAAQDRLIQTEKLASLGQLTAGIAHEIKNPLNFVNNFASLSTGLLEEMVELHTKMTTDPNLRSNANELMSTLQSNLEKIEQHGKRADSIVKNMLLHSRQGSGEHRLTDINAVVEESLNLAYHGARAERQGFNIVIQRDLDPGAGQADIFPQEITRVLLNLISNGFYATAKRASRAIGDYEPVLAAATKNLGEFVEIRIRDNGTGIPADVKKRLFTPFFTTKPAGEGTGLGLSLSHDIVVKQHAGIIEVYTEPAEYTEFRIVLPRRALLDEKGTSA